MTNVLDEFARFLCRNHNAKFVLLYCCNAYKQPVGGIISWPKTDAVALLSYFPSKYILSLPNNILSTTFLPVIWSSDFSFNFFFKLETLRIVLLRPKSLGQSYL